MGKRRGVYVCWFISDWLSSTARAELDLAGQAAYFNLLLLQASYGAKGQDCIPKCIVATDKSIAGFLGCSVEEWKVVKDDVLKHFDRVKGGGLRNPRMAREIEFANKKSKAGKAGSDARWNG